LLELELPKIIGQEKFASAVDLNRKLMERNSNSFVHRFESSKLVYLLDQNQICKQNEINLITNDMDNMDNVAIEACTGLMKSLKVGDFGSIEEKVVEDYREK